MIMSTIREIAESEVPYAIRLHKAGRVTFTAITPEGAGPWQYFVQAETSEKLDHEVKEIQRRRKIATAINRRNALSYLQL